MSQTENDLTKLESPSVDPREIYRRIVGVVTKRKWTFLGCLLTAVGVVAAYLATATKLYEAHASIIIYSATPQVLGGQFRDVVDVEMGSWWSAREYIQTQYDELRSESLAKSVAERLEKTDDIKKLGLVPGADGREQAAALIGAVLTVDPVKDSRTVNLSVRYKDPDVAAMLANTIAETYKDRNYERRIGQSRGSAKWLSEQLSEQKDQLERSEMALYEFKRSNNVISVSLQDNLNIISNEMKRLSEAATEAKTRRIQLGARRKVLGEMRTKDPTYDGSKLDTKGSDAVVKLKETFIEQNAKLLELQGKYLDEHPAVIAQKARVDAIRSELRKEADQAFKATEVEYALALETEKNLSSALEQAKEEAIAVNKKEIEYDRLKRNADNNAKLYELLLARLKESGLASQLPTNNVRLLDAARPSGTPVTPRVPLAITLGILLGLFSGLGICFLLDFMDSTVKSQEDVETTAGIPFLGLIPKIEGEEESTVRESGALHIFERPKSAVAECCRAIRTNILFMSPDRPLKSLLVTSSGPMEGKSTTSINLAVTMALSGNRVLLIDTDLRRPRLHRAFGVPSEAGMSTLVVGESTLEDVIKSTQVPNLWVMPCGPLPPNPAELFHAGRFREIIAQLATQYDRLIFDSPPLGVVTDAAVLSALVDGTVLVARSSRTTREMLRRARRQLADIKAPVLGCILNGVDLNERDGGRGYYYYQRYGYYYGDEKADHSAGAG